MKEYAEGAGCALLLALVLAAYAVGGPVAGTVTAVLGALFVIIILLARIAHRSSTP